MDRLREVALPSTTMSHVESQEPRPDPISPARTPLGNLTKRDYFAVHLFQAVTANLSQNCSLQDKAEYAVDAADALIRALEKKAQ